MVRVNKTTKLIRKRNVQKNIDRLVQEELQRELNEKIQKAASPSLNKQKRDLNGNKSKTTRVTQESLAQQRRELQAQQELNKKAQVNRESAGGTAGYLTNKFSKGLVGQVAERVVDLGLDLGLNTRNPLSYALAGNSMGDLYEDLFGGEDYVKLTPAEKNALQKQENYTKLSMIGHPDANAYSLNNLDKMHIMSAELKIKQGADQSKERFKTFRESVEKGIAKDAIGETQQRLYNLGQGKGYSLEGYEGPNSFANVLESKSLAKEGDFVSQAAEVLGQGIGQAYTANLFGGGPLSTLTVVPGAYASGVEEAYKQGADTDKARLYALGSAATEVVSEMITGGIPGTNGVGGLDFLADKGIDKISNRVARKLVRMGYKAAGEAGEEVLAEAINPYIKRATYDPNAQNATAEELLTAGLLGALSAGVIEIPSNVIGLRSAVNDEKIKTAIKQNLNEDNAQIFVDELTKRGYDVNEARDLVNESLKETQQPSIDTSIVNGKVNFNGTELTESEVNSKIKELNDIIPNLTETKQIARVEDALDALYEAKNNFETMSIKDRPDLYNKIENEKQMIHSSGNILDILKNDTIEGDFGIQVQNKGARPAQYNGGIEGIKFKPDVVDIIKKDKLYKGDGGTNREQYVSENTDLFDNLEELFDDDTSKRISKYNQINVKEGTPIQDFADTIEIVSIAQNAPQKLIDRLNELGIKYEINKNVNPIYKTEETVYNKSPEVETGNKNKTFATVAPYYSTTVTDENYETVRDEIEAKFTENAKNIANNLGIGIKHITNNIGGYSFDENTRVDELSYTYELNDNVSTEDATLFGCLLGDIGHEVQDSVVVGKYTDFNDPDANLEYSLKLDGDIDVITILKEVDITDYTFDKKTNELQLLIFKNDNNEFDVDDTINKITKLLERIGGITNVTENRIASELIESETRESIYKTWLESHKREQNGELYENVEQAYNKVKEFNNKKQAKAQLEIINKYNPMTDDYHTGIRKVEDIKTFEEAIEDEDSFVWGDYSKEDAERDLKKGTVTIYSSYPIEQGVFVSTSKNQARDYAGNSEIYSKTVPLTEVAWINGDEGQYAKITTEQNTIAEKIEKAPEEVIKVRPNEGNIRSWSQTVTEGDYEGVDLVKEIVEGMDNTYMPQENQKGWDKATAEFDSLGYEAAIKKAKAVFESGKRIKLDDIMFGQKMLTEAARRNDVENVSYLLQELSIAGTELGQNVQALSVIKKLTPEGQLKVLQKTIDRLKAKNPKPNEDLHLTDEMINTILDSETETDLQNNVDEVKKLLAQQMKGTLGDKINAWRYFSMLGNPKTHIRNIVSNMAMSATTNIKNVIARSIETALNKFMPKLYENQDRTKTFRKTSREVTEYLTDYINKNKNILSVEGKYKIESQLNLEKKAFNSTKPGKLLQKAMDFNSYLLNQEDFIVKNKRFKKAVGEYLTANGINTVEEIEANPKLFDSAVNYGIEEAWKATFQQYSALADSLNKIQEKNKIFKVVMDAVLPFKQTPINIAKTGLEYSPIGLLKTVTKNSVDLKNGKIDVNQYIDNISKGLTGSGIMLLGYTLAQMGILSGQPDDNDKEEQFEKALGRQDFSINIGGQSFTIDWLTPTSMPLLVGVTISDLDTDTFNLNNVSDMFMSTLQPLVELSFLQSIDNALSTYSTEGIQGSSEEFIKSYISQYVPTVGGQIAKTIDPVYRSTAASATSPFKFGEEILRQNMTKIPGLSFLLEPQTDLWGNEKQRSNNVIIRAFENFIAPYSRMESLKDSVSKEIQNIYSETGEDGVIPSIPSTYYYGIKKTVKFDNEEYPMTAEQYTEFKKTYGELAHESLEKLFDTNTYKRAANDDKVNMIENVYKYAKDIAKKDFLETQGIEYTNTKKDNEKIYRDNNIKEVIELDVTTDEIKYKNQYPTAYNTAKLITKDYDKYESYRDEIDKIKENYSYDDLTGKKLITQQANRKQAIIKYVRSLSDLNATQKAMLIKQTYSGYKDFDRQIKQYINNSDLSKEEKKDILKNLNIK